MTDQYVITIPGSNDPEAIAGAKKQLYASRGDGQISTFIAEMYKRDIKDSILRPYLRDPNTQILFEAAKRKTNPNSRYDPNDDGDYQNLVTCVSNKKAVKDQIHNNLVSKLADTTKLAQLCNSLSTIFEDWVVLGADASDYFDSLADAHSV